MRSQLRLSLLLIQPHFGAHFLSSQVLVLILSCPLGVTHTSTNTNLISQVTEMPQAGGGAEGAGSCSGLPRTRAPPDPPALQVLVSQLLGVGFQDNMNRKGTERDGTAQI